MGSQPGFLASQNQQQQATQPPNFPAFFQPNYPNIPFAVPEIQTNNISTAQVVNPTPVPSTSAAQTEAHTEAAAPPNPPAAQQQEAAQRRFPNIIQDEQENRDWLDILYSMSRLMILLCLVYFYSSPFRCLIVIIIGVAIYW